MAFDRKSILTKIKALLAKTVENGCTEAEAFAALDKARAMMDAHDISDTDLAFGGEEVKQDRVRRHDPDGIRWGMGLCNTVAKFCDCKAWGEKSSGKIVFLGLESDVMFATWLLDTLETFVRRQSLQFLAEMGRAQAGTTDLFGTPLNGHEREHKRRSFIIGCVNRICDRMREAITERRGTVTSTGRDLVVVKNALVENAFRALNIKLKSPRSRKVSVDYAAYDRGVAAGNRANLGRPVNGGAGVQAIAC